MNMIQKCVATLSIPAIILAGTIPAWSAPRPKHYMILLDLSVSNPLVRSTRHASDLANQVKDKLSGLKFRDRITMRTFGEYNVSLQLTKEFKVDFFNKPARVKRSVARLISSIPSAVGQKKSLKVQGQTNIVGSLQRAKSRMNCKSRNTHVIVVSDGMENSDYGTLPPTQNVEPLFKGCKSLTFVGINGSNPQQTNKLEKAWAAWSKAVGFQNFSAIL